MSKHSNSKFTFGNILIGLLALGTLIVSALIALLYFEVTRTPKRTAAVVEDNSSRQPAAVEAMSPDGAQATVVRKLGVGNEASQAASQTDDPNRLNEAAAAADALNGTAALPPLNTRALTSGQNVQRKPRPKRPPREQNGEGSTNRNSERSNRSQTNGEVVLEPINVPRERPLQPRRERSDSGGSGERGSRSRNSQSSGGERELTPVRPQSRPAQNNKQSEAIDALF